MLMKADALIMTQVELDWKELDTVEHYIGFALGMQEMEKERQQADERHAKLQKFMRGGAR